MKQGPENTEMIKANPATALPAAPDFMREDGREGTEELGQHIRPPRIKIITDSAKEELKAEFGVGAVVVFPDKEVLISPEYDTQGQAVLEGAPTFKVVPLFFFAEYYIQNPYALKDLPMIRERSFDPQSRIAQRARSTNRKDPCPENMSESMLYVEDLNFLCIVSGHPTYRDTGAILSFSKGNFTLGSAFGRLVKQREGPMYGGRYEATLVPRKNPKHDWLGLSMSNPEKGAWVKNAKNYEAYRALHHQFKQDHKNNLIIVEHDEDNIIDVDPAATRATPSDDM